MNEYYFQRNKYDKDINLKISDTIIQKNGYNVIVKIEVIIKKLEVDTNFNKLDQGKISFSMTKIKTDNKGNAKLFSRNEGSYSINSDEIIFEDLYKKITIKKELVDLDSNEVFKIDLELDEISKKASTSTQLDKDQQRIFSQETERVNATYYVKGKINDEIFSNKAEASLFVNCQADSYKSKTGFYINE